MPFVARKDGQTVIPADVDDGEDVSCPTCGGTMRARGPFDDGRARHFYHINTVTTCNRATTGNEAGPAESATHQKLKALAVTGLREWFDADPARCGPEISLDVSDTATAVDTRRADALLEFTDTNRFYGEGVIVEVQHLNAGKNIRATTHDYLQLGYSVYWATVDDFASDRFLTTEMEDAFNTDADAAFAAYHSEPPALDAPNPLVAPDDNSPYTTHDPVPDCDHEFVPGEEAYRRCVRCGLETELCVYDERNGVLRRLDMVGDGYSNEVVWAADQRSIDRPVTIRSIDEQGNPVGHTHRWSHPTKIFSGKKYQCLECDSELRETKTELVIHQLVARVATHTAGDGETDCDHTWEDLGFTKVCTECQAEVKPWDES